MTATKLPKMVACSGGSIRNDEIQPPTDPILILTLEAQDKSVYLLPLSDKVAESLLQVLASLPQLQDYLSELELPARPRLQ